MPDIIQLTPDTWTLTARGAKMTLERRPSSYGDWHMTTDNASARAWTGILMPKSFENLVAVETHYKSWRGIKALIECDQSIPSS